jgi:hypothetical protein
LQTSLERMLQCHTIPQRKNASRNRNGKRKQTMLSSVEVKAAMGGAPLGLQRRRYKPCPMQPQRTLLMYCKENPSIHGRTSIPNKTKYNLSCTKSETNRLPDDQRPCPNSHLEHHFKLENKPSIHRGSKPRINNGTRNTK